MQPTYTNVTVSPQNWHSAIFRQTYLSQSLHRITDFGNTVIAREQKKRTRASRQDSAYIRRYRKRNKQRVRVISRARTTLAQCNRANGNAFTPPPPPALLHPRVASPYRGENQRARAGERKHAGAQIPECKKEVRSRSFFFFFISRDLIVTRGRGRRCLQ